MGKGQVPPHAFKPGVSGNPSGRPKVLKDIAEARKQNSNSVARILNRFMNMDFDELKKLMQDPATQTLELMIGRVIVESIKTGDQTRLNFILDRMIGKVVDKMEIKVPKPTMVKILDGPAIMLDHEKDEE